MSTSLHWLILRAGPVELEDWARGNLAASERARLSGLRFERRRRSFLLGRFAAKMLLAGAEPDLANTPPAGFAILNGPEGAPYVDVAGRGRLAGCLSLSHCEDGAACAWCSDPACRHGIDLERVEARHPAFADDYLTPAENAFAADLPEALRPVWITLAWSAREAALKALGAGLRLDTRRLAVSPPEPASMAAAPGWQPLRVAVCGDTPANLDGWWQRRGDFILTLVTSGDAARTTLLEHSLS